LTGFDFVCFSGDYILTGFDFVCFTGEYILTGFDFVCFTGDYILTGLGRDQAVQRCVTGALRPQS
jgi:hypothetical protein